MTRINVDQDKCIGSANCEYWAPDTFEVDPETQKSTVLDPEGDDLDLIERAVTGCPTGAISVVDESSADTGHP